MTRFSFKTAHLLQAALVWSLALTAVAQSQLPTDVGTVVAGFQDDFDGTALNPSWTVAGDNVYSVSNGVLHVNSATSDPNHLLYELPGYDNTVQEVLARVRVLSYGSGDLVRGGVGVGVDPNTTQGINYLFRENTSDSQTSLHLALLNDMVLWGPVQNFVWQLNTWYWIRLRQEPNAASQGGANDVFAKIWLADGSQAEPANWQLTWNYTPTDATRTGFAGITASSGSPFQFDVDYILIKAAGLPNITVAPNAFVQIPAAISAQPTNETVMELSAADFSVAAVGNPAPSYQWYRSGFPITGATSSSYRLVSAGIADNGAQFQAVVQNVVSNLTHSITSSVATLTVIADTNPPILVDARPLGLTQVQVDFSERIAAAGATNPANFQITSTNAPVSITGISLDFTQTNVVLSVAGLSDGATYNLTVNNLTDQSAAANRIAPNSEVQFVAGAYSPLSLGNSEPPGSQVPAGNGYNISAGGAAVGGTNDQCQFNYQTRSGDFDFKVRLDSLGLADAWSEAGLMARADLSPGSVSASVLATPSISGAFFQSRAQTNGPTSNTGSFPVNYPNTWLRLKRAGNVLTGFAGFDGQNWTALGSLNVGLPANLYFGLVVSSHNTNQLTTAAFRDLGVVSNPGTNEALSFEPLGQCSRRTSLVLSEIMYHPTNSSLEFIELFNSRGEPQDLSGYQIGGSVSYTFPAGSRIEGGGFVLVAKSPTDLENTYGLQGVFGPYTNNLPNSKGTVRLSNQAGGVLLEANYDSVPPWPVSPDGAGHSLVLARPSYGEDNVLAWEASDRVGGSPGALDPISTEPLRALAINEFLAQNGPTGTGFVEIFNRSGQALDVSGCSLSDDAKLAKFIFPAGTVIGAHGFLVWDQSTLGFAPSTGGGTLYLRNPSGNCVLDALRYEGQQPGVSFGRVPDGSPALRPLSAATAGTNNSPSWRGDIVINEIMYAPVSLNDDDQYVELYNRGTNAVDLAGWQFNAGIQFVFPPNTTMAPGAYLVVARNAARLRTHYPNLNAGNLVGDFAGTLSHHGERLALVRPLAALTRDSQGAWVTNTVYPVVNEVSYQPGGQWGQWADGGGSSLELIDPRADNALGPNWADSDETAKAAWTTISATGTIDNGDASVPADELQVLIEGVGEALIDNVQVLDNAGSNHVANGTFESGAGGWTAEGTEKTSSLETTEGFNSSRSFHLRAVEKGDNQVNRVRVLLTSPLPAGSTNVTIRAAVRWLKGDPEILLRLRGNWLECAAPLPTPLNLGTPGARNSSFSSNAPPSIVQVRHSPVLPAAGEPIVVTAQIHDPDGLSSVFLKYRLDPATAYSVVPMTDDGTGADAAAGDGVFTATIPGQVAGTMVAFYVQATDGSANPAGATFPNDAPARECLVRVGETQPTGNFPVYRLWMTQATLNTWNQNSRLDNTFNNVTFVLGDQRVIYNSGARFKGSPYISPGYCGATCGRCGYSISFPSDDLFQGETELVLDWPGGHGGETTALQEQMCYWIADRLNLPWSHRHTVRLHINGVTDEARQATFEAVVQPAGSFVKEWVPNDSGGELFKIERAFEFNDSGGLVADPEPRLQNFLTTGGQKKREHYRWNFMFRSTDRRDDYTNIFALVDAVNANGPEPYTSATLGLVNVEEWMGIFATEHIVENFDAYGHEIGKNMYAYLPPNGKWQLYLFDLDWAMLAAPIYSSRYTASAGPLFNSEDPTISRMYAFPPFARAYWRAVQNAVNGPLDPAVCNPVIDAKSRSLFANGINWCDGQRLTDAGAVKTWFSQRRAALQAQLATIAAPFVVSSVQTSNDVALVSGTAPIAVQNIWFNGALWPITWSSVSNWTAKVVLEPGTNSWIVQGVDPQGQAVTDAMTNLTAVSSATTISPVGQVVINEVMYAPPIPGAEYVELYNNSSNRSFDLSGWQFKGLSYTFPPGALIGPNSFLVLTANRAAFAAAYGATTPVFDTFNGVLQPDGETLTLLQPTGGSNQAVAKIRYASAPPWPTAAAQTGSSLQLIDPLQDNWRVGNWSIANSNSAAGPQWQYVTLTGIATQPVLLICMHGTPGDVYIDDLKLVAGSVPDAGTNLLQDGDFETALSGPWTVSANMTNSAISTSTRHSGNASLHVVAASPGDTLSQAIWENTAPLTGNGTYTLSYWYLPSSNGTQLLIRLSGSSPGNGQIYSLQNIQPPIANSLSTPGAPNSVSASLPQFPPLWVNELQPENLNGITTRSGQRVPWLELFNPSTNVVSLSGVYLSTNYANLTGWGFPAGAIINPDEFKIIFADGQPGLSTATELHTSFSLAPGAGSLSLSRLYNGQPQVLDYVDYTNLAPNHSYGSLPDGQSFDRQEFVVATPGGTNDATVPLSYIPYTTPGAIYAQNFDSLPDPGTGSVNSDNPVTINGVVYNLANPFGFAEPVLGGSGSGGLGIVQMAGWYGLGSLAAKFGASDGDQTTGGQISFGAPGSSNRALGLLATSSTGATAFGARLVNLTTLTLNSISVRFTGELWRQSNVPKTLQCFYAIDPGGSAAWPTAPSGWLPGLNVNLATSSSAVGGAAVDGTNPLNQTNLSIASQPINDWAPGAALWLVWQMSDATGKAQGLAIDDLTFSASSSPGNGQVPMSFQATGTNAVVSWMGVAGQIYQLEYKSDLGAATWTPLGSPLTGSGTPLSFTIDFTTASRGFYRLRITP